MWKHGCLCVIMFVGTCSVFFHGVSSCSLNGDHPSKDVRKVGNHCCEDLAKSSYKPKYKSLINLLYSLLHIEFFFNKSDNFYYLFLTL
jgi:hypothetical protein